MSPSPNTAQSTAHASAGPSAVAGTIPFPSASGRVTRRLEALLQGDGSAAAWLFDTFAGDLLRRLRGRYGWLDVDPEDLLQDAYVFYFQNDCKVLRDFLDRVPERGRTETRLARHLWDLACGVASNHRRRGEVRSETHALTEDQERTLRADDSLEDHAVDKDQLERLEDCLRQKGRRLALYGKLRFRDGYTPNEISDMTGWSMKATYKLRQALTDAVDACRQALGLQTD